jgi:hypothetical protein
LSDRSQVEPAGESSSPPVGPPGKLELAELGRRGGKVRGRKQPERASDRYERTALKIEAELAQGASVAVVAQNAGVSPRSVTNWLAQGMVVRRRAPDPIIDPATSTATGLNRLHEAEDGLLAVVLKAAQRGSWPAAMKLLAVIRPEVYGNRNVQAAAERPAPAPTTEEKLRHQHTFAEIDELARRRQAGARR